MVSVLLDGIELPRAGYALELVCAALVEAQAGAGDESFRGAGHQDFAGTGKRRDSSADVHGDARQLGPKNLTLAGMQPGANGETQTLNGIGDRARGANATRGPIEGGEDAVARRI